MSSDSSDGRVDTGEFHQRINAALERIAGAVETMRAAPDPAPDPVVAPAPDPDAAQALEEERLANAQLKERIKALRSRLESAEAERDEARSAGDAGARALGDADAALQSLRKANARLRQTVAALQEAHQQGLSEPHLLNKAMLSELEALRATQAADRSEMDAILAGLDAALATADGPEGAGDTKTENA